jgi:hypothetical protein
VLFYDLLLSFIAASVSRLVGHEGGWEGGDIRKHSRRKIREEQENTEPRISMACLSVQR